MRLLTAQKIIKINIIQIKTYENALSSMLWLTLVYKRAFFLHLFGAELIKLNCCVYLTSFMTDSVG